MKERGKRNCGSDSAPHFDPPAAKPAWLRVRLGGGVGYRRVQAAVEELRLHTVCEEAMCPNRGSCWEKGHATIMILGGKCTRGCRFCGVEPAVPDLPDAGEPDRVAAAVVRLGLRNVVITSVTRDDLEDGGAAIWAATLEKIRLAAPTAVLEALIPDFRGRREYLDMVLAARPDVLGHNLETVPSLYPTVRRGADYGRSLAVLDRAGRAGLITKTAVMVGLGETIGELAQMFRDARSVGVKILFIGQYLQPTRRHIPAARYLEPFEFQELRKMALEMGFDVVVAGPLVRSSYHSPEQAAFLERMRAGQGMPAPGGG